VLSALDLEHYLTELFEGALGVHPVGREENFFALGGDSLVFVNLLVTLENRLGRSLPIDALAERPTIADMLQALEHPVPALAPPVSIYHDHLDPLTVMKHVLRESNLAFHEKRRRLLDLIYVRLMYTGPRFFDYTLPYAIGTRVLEWVCRHEGLTKLIFRKRADTVHSGLAALHPTNKTEAFRQSLRTQVWMYWRLAALARCARAEFDRWVSVAGLETFRHALAQGRGVVLVMSHLAPLFFSPLALGRLHFDNFLVVGPRLHFAALLDLLGLSHLKERHHFAVTDHDRRRASQLLTAQRWLSEGHIVLISGDGDQGKLPLLLPFCGRQRRFGVGFAELAVRAGASVIPIFHSMAPGGHLTMEFLTPLEARGETRQDTVGAFVRQYATLLEQRWLRDPGSVHIEQLNRFLSLPLVTP
jgi:lauroyl/myristoyl acyltransferase/acyl carrier protein